MTIPFDPTEELFPQAVATAPQPAPEAPTPAPAEEAASAPAPVIAHTGVDALTPAGRIAALTALRDAIDEEVKREKSRITDNLAGATTNTALPTPFGDLSYRPGKRPVKIDDDKLIAYVKQVAPEMVTVQTVVTESIPDDLRELLTKDVIHCGDNLFARGSTGESIDYAYLGEETASAISWPASREQKITKSLARQTVRDNMERLTAPMLEAGK